MVHIHGSCWARHWLLGCLTLVLASSKCDVALGGPLANHVRANFMERTSFLRVARDIEKIKGKKTFSRGNVPVVLVTYMFGAGSVRKPYLPAVFQTLSMPGVDTLIIGDSKPQFELPPNVYHHQITFRELTELAAQKLFGGDALNNMFSHEHPHGNHSPKSSTARGLHAPPEWPERQNLPHLGPSSVLSEH